MDQKVWVPKLQQENDVALMQIFVRLPGTTREQLCQLNLVWVLLQVITLEDLTHPSRGYIPDGTLTGNWQTGTDLEWPEIPSQNG